MSTYNIHLGDIPFLQYPFTNLLLKIILLLINLPGTNTDRLLSIILSMIGCILLESTLEIILCNKVQQDISLHSKIFEG